MIRETSRDIYCKIRDEGLIGHLQFLVYEFIFNHGPVTQKQAQRHFGDMNYSIRPRFVELERMGVVRAIGKKPCPETGNESMVWDVTAKLPVKAKNIEPKSIVKERQACAAVATDWGLPMLAEAIRNRNSGH